MSLQNQRVQGKVER